MRVKRYVVDSMPDALQKIRTELGKDAVILNTKEVRSGGFLGFFGKKKIEVIAAIDSSSAPPSNNNAVPIIRANPVKPAAAPVHYPLSMPTSSSVALLDKEEPAVQVPKITFPEPKMITTEEMLLSEIKQMKEMMKRFSQGTEVIDELPAVFQQLKLRLLEQEVDTELVDELISQVIEESEAGQAELTEAFALKSIHRQLQALLRSQGSKSIDEDTKVVHFVGPTGVGKTTTIAKLAAEQVLKNQKKVAFITSDTYRIAAIEQLKTYANILNVPIEVVFSPQDLHRAFQQFQDVDLIFMDTAGRNFRNEMYVSELNTLLKTQGKSETFLVLSLSSKYRDMKTITQNFSKFKLDKVLFTKFDETSSYGAIVNLMHDFSLQLSYITNGQNVPDDISEINEKEIVDFILEGNSDD
jgi:flagellar biosynthesis protein FlhF